MEETAKKKAAQLLASLRKREDYRCARCGRPFTTCGPRARYCSPACRTAAYRERKKNETP